MADKLYSCDITKKQFNKILPFLKTIKKNTKPTKVNLYRVFCRVSYILKTGSQWESMPNDYPKHGTVYYHFAQWNEEYKDTGRTTLDILQNKLVGDTRESLGRDKRTTFMI